MLLTIRCCNRQKLHYSYEQIVLVEMFINIFQKQKKIFNEFQIY